MKISYAKNPFFVSFKRFEYLGFQNIIGNRGILFENSHSKISSAKRKKM